LIFIFISAKAEISSRLSQYSSVLNFRRKHLNYKKEHLALFAIRLLFYTVYRFREND